MTDFENEIRLLRQRTEANRRDFLRVEVQTCFIAIERARLEISLGDTHEAEKEFVIATRGTQVIERFLNEAANKMPEIQVKLAELKASLALLRSEIDAYRG